MEKHHHPNQKSGERQGTQQRRKIAPPMRKRRTGAPQLRFSNIYFISCHSKERRTAVPPKREEGKSSTANEATVGTAYTTTATPPKRRTVVPRQRRMDNPAPPKEGERKTLHRHKRLCFAVRCIIYFTYMVFATSISFHFIQKKWDRQHLPMEEEECSTTQKERGREQ